MSQKSKNLKQMHIRISEEELKEISQFLEGYGYSYTKTEFARRAMRMYKNLLRDVEDGWKIYGEKEGESKEYVIW